MMLGIKELMLGTTFHYVFVWPIVQQLPIFSFDVVCAWRKTVALHLIVHKE
jgi:hypothetical protein